VEFGGKFFVGSGFESFCGKNMPAAEVLGGALVALVPLDEIPLAR
jgi:hypothetical protein